MPKRKHNHDDPELLAMPELRKLWQTEGLFSDHYLKARLKLNDWWPTEAAARPIWEFCKALYEKRAFSLRKYDNEMGVRQEFIDKIIEKIGFAWSDNLRLPETQQDLEPDYLLYASEEEKEAVLDKDVIQRYQAAIAILEAKKFGHPLSQRSRSQQRYPHQQIRDYLNEAQSLAWGILTNGSEWRLYCRDTKPSYFFAINFELAIRSLDEFKFFLALFSPAAFVRDAQGKCRLDQVRENALATQSELEADLRQRIFGVVEILANGFAERPENKITDANLAFLYENCLIFLYRLLFILYAEGRLLLPVEPKSRKYYRQLSLVRLLTPLKNFTNYDSQTQTRFYRDILALCTLINGTDKKANDEFGVPRYNGGLFDPARHPRLNEWAVADSVLADVLRQLMFTPEKRGQKFVPFESVDYSDLSVQQLGSIYEGLLEHRFVRERGKLVLKTDKVERKATGTYYTPDYIVKYIVEQTLTPLLQEIEEREPVKAARAAGERDNSFANEVLKLNICDPAMGSGHFLVETIIFLADEIVYHPTTKFQAEFVKGKSQEETEIAYWRRRVVESCIYGVDLNPLAVELAKLSLWLTTISTDQPLNFLDHHLRIGNSLIGARLDQLGSLPAKKGRSGPLGVPAQIQFTFGPDFKRVVAESIGQIHRIEDKASRDVNDVKEKEKRWEVEILPRLAPYKKVADLWMNAFFDGPLSEEEYMAAAKTILVEAQASVDQLQEPAARYRIKALDEPYFHWELEFPEVFFNEDGAPRENGGFDAVLGNPPWLGLRTGAIKPSLLNWLRLNFITSVGQFDLAATFCELACRLSSREAVIGEVVPKRLLTNESYEDLRKMLAVQRHLSSAVDLGVAFEGVDNDAAILISGKRPDARGVTMLGSRFNKTSLRFHSLPSATFQAMPFHIIPVNSEASSITLATKIAAGDVIPLGDLAEVTRGAECGMNHPAISRLKTQGALPLIDHLDMSRHQVAHGGWFVDPSKIESAVLKPAALYETVPKLLIRFLSAGIVAARDDVGYASTNLVYHVACGKESGFLCAILCSRLLNFWYRTAFQNEEVKFPHVQKSQLICLPIRRIEVTTPEKRRSSFSDKARQLYQHGLVDGKLEGVLAFVVEQLAAKPERADVIHDLLTFLAERMAALSQEASAAAKQFVTSLKVFHGVDVHSLKPKTKLDEFWKLETPEVFAHFRANRLCLEDSDEDKIGARFQKAKDQIVPLGRQIAFTDALIDQIVYRLYGLTPEEIQLVEGSMSC
jgi:Cu/Ag efflux protein CusF